MRCGDFVVFVRTGSLKYRRLFEDFGDIFNAQEDQDLAHFLLSAIRATFINFARNLQKIEVFSIFDNELFYLLVKILRSRVCF